MKEIAHILRFEPLYKSVLWGGDKIAAFKGVSLGRSDIGESWELSAVPGHISVVADGPFAGMSINDLIARFGADLLGTGVVERYGTDFPLLIKFIDTRRATSLQVHPGDELARSRHGLSGKTEMWYVIDADLGAEVLCGLNKPLDTEGFKDAVANGDILDYVARYATAKGQLYYIPAGTIHAIGAGNLIAEIQQSSDLTYRVYDYDRTDEHGNRRELHTADAADAINYDEHAKEYPTAANEDNWMLDLPYFTVHHCALSGDAACHFYHDGRSFTAIVVLEGTITIKTDDETVTSAAGTTLLVPAAVANFSLTGTAKALIVKI